MRDTGYLPEVEVHRLGVNPTGLDGVRALCQMYAGGKLQRKHDMYIDVGSKSGVDVMLDVIRQGQAPGLLHVFPGNSTTGPTAIFFLKEGRPGAGALLLHF